MGERLTGDESSSEFVSSSYVDVNGTFVDSDNQSCFHNEYNYYQYIIVVYIGSPIALIGIFNNLCLAYCLLLSGGRNNCGTTNVYFSVLAFFDVGICVLYVLLFAVDALALYHEIYPLWKMWMGYVLPLLTGSRIIQLTSTYIVVAATIERFFIVVNFRLISKIFCTPAKRQLCIVILIMITAMIRLPSYWDYAILYQPECESFDRFSTINFEALLMKYQFYKNIYTFYIVQIVQIFLPTITLVVLNAVIVYYLRRQLNLAKRFVFLFPEKCVSQQVIETGLSKDKVRKATNTLVAIVTSYLVCNTIHLLLSIMEHVARVPYLEDENGAPTDMYNYLTDVVSLLFMFNSSIRLFIHMSSNETLRKQMLSIYTCRCRPRKYSSSVDTTTVMNMGTNSAEKRFSNGLINKEASYPLLKCDDNDNEEGEPCKETIV